MAGIAAVFVALYGPLLIAALSLIALLRLQAGTDNTAVRFRPFFDFVDIEIPVSHLWLRRGLLLLTVATSLSSYLLLDYSALFPDRLKMDVFFDDKGLERELAVFDRDELRAMNLVDDFHDPKEEYYRAVDEVVRALAGVDGFYSLREGIVHSSGETSFVVENIDGWQRYHIAEAAGELTHVLEIPGRIERRLFTVFEKLPSSDDYLDIGLGEFLWKNGVILSPRFKEFMTSDRTTMGTTLRFTVVGITKVRVFPWPRIGATVYCAEFAGMGLVPVAYALYR